MQWGGGYIDLVGNAFRDALRRKRTQSVRNGVPTQSIGTIVIVIVRNSERL